jgi:hypothetical protein
VADRWFWGLLWTRAHVAWYSKAPDDYERIWGGMMRTRAPGVFVWTLVFNPIFMTGSVLAALPMWRNYRAGRPSGDSPDADRWWNKPPF